MKITRLIIGFVLLAMNAHAAAPKQLLPARYTKLWTDSPFTSKPIVVGPGPVANPLEDYSLGGISKLADGYFAILFNSKKPDEKVVIRPGSKSEFTIVKVDWADNWRETVVTLRNGATTGTVTFDEKQITINAPAAKPQAKPPLPGQLGTPPQPGQPNVRTPRPRVVVPPPKR
jgi:hypothetical protein